MNLNVKLTSSQNHVLNGGINVRIDDQEIDPIVKNNMKVSHLKRCSATIYGGTLPESLFLFVEFKKRIPKNPSDNPICELEIRLRKSSTSGTPLEKITYQCQENSKFLCDLLPAMVERFSQKSKGTNLFPVLHKSLTLISDRIFG